MFSPAFIAWVHWMCILFACSCASTCLFVLIVEGLFPVETSQRVQLQVLLLNFSALNILYYYILYAEDVSPNAPEAPPKSEVAVLSPTPTFLIRDCDHRALDHEIEMLRIENEKLQAQTTEARKDVVKAQTTKELAEQEKDKVDRKLQATEQKCKTEYLSHIDVSDLDNSEYLLKANTIQSGFAN